MNDIRLRAGLIPSVVYPLTPGHQFAGEVHSAGADASEFAQGDRVVVHSYVVCGKCSQCRAGAGPHDCETFRTMGFSRDGGMAEYCAVPARHLFRLEERVTMEAASLVENLANAVAAVRTSSPPVGGKIVIIGATPIGLLAVQVARLLSPSALILAGRSAGRLRLAADLGATGTVDTADEGHRRELSRLTGERGADTAIVCGYEGSDLQLALDIAGSGGVVHVEGHFDPTVEVPLSPSRHLLSKALTLTVNRGWRTEDFARAVDLVTSSVVDVLPLVTHRYPLYEWEAAFDTFTDTDGEAVQVVLTP